MAQGSLECRGVLLDIEGTTSSIRFVYDEMFPFVRRELDSFLATHWEHYDVQNAAEQIARDAGASGLGDWSANHEPIECVVAEVHRLMDDDVKATGLKQLQGLIWESGFKSGELKAHLYPDVEPALQRWKDNGVDIRIYSSGSVKAQELFFGHTIAGNLLHYFSGHYDTKIGSKRDTSSYKHVVEQFGLAAGELLFVSDVPEELDAARGAGMQTRLCCRPGNAPIDASVSHAQITSFAQL